MEAARTFRIILVGGVQTCNPVKPKIPIILAVMLRNLRMSSQIRFRLHGTTCSTVNCASSACTICITGLSAQQVHFVAEVIVNWSTTNIPLGP